MNVSCPDCGRQLLVQPSSIRYCNDRVFLPCLFCGCEIPLLSETVSTPKVQLECQEPDYEEGQLVVITNEQHAWHGEIGIVRAKKHLYCRIEINGKLIWLPSTWIKPYDNSDNYADA